MIHRQESMTGHEEKPIVMAGPDRMKVTVISVRAKTQAEMEFLFAQAKDDASHVPEFGAMGEQEQQKWLVNRMAQYDNVIQDVKAGK